MPEAANTEPEQKSEGTVWHHTDAEGLLGIVTRHRIWASSPLSMNDVTELRYGERILREAWDLLDRSAWAEEEHSFMDAIMAADLATLAEESCFLVCATAKRDSLNNWQGYSGRQGYALEIDCEPRLTPVGKALGANTLPPDGRLGTFSAWFHVAYMRDAQLERAARYLNTAKMFVKFPIPAHERGRRRMAQGWLVTAMAQFKDPAFADEREVRYIASSAYLASGEAFRPGRRGIIPYLEVAEPARPEFILATAKTKRLLPIRGVMCGPGPSKSVPHASPNVFSRAAATT